MKKKLTKKQQKKLFVTIQQTFFEHQKKHQVADDLFMIPDGTIYQYCLTHQKYETGAYLKS